MIRYFSLLTLAACAVLLTACRSSGDKTPPGGTNVDAVQVLTKAVNSRRSGDCVVANGDMKIFDKGSNFSLGMQIENFAAVYPDKMRLKTTKLAGSIDVFDALMRGDNIAFFVPRHNTLYTGKVSELNNGGGLSFSPELIVARLLKGDRALLDKKWKTISAPGGKKGSRPADLEIEEIHRPGDQYLRIRLDPRKQVITRIAYCDRQNTEYLVEEYGNYRDPDNGRNPDMVSLFPTRFNLLWPGKDRFVKINLKRVDLNRRPAELAEAFSGIDGVDLDRVKRKALGQAHIDSDPSTMQDGN